jgi:hypothetical protein
MPLQFPVATCLHKVPKELVTIKSLVFSPVNHYEFWTTQLYFSLLFMAMSKNDVGIGTAFEQQYRRGCNVLWLYPKRRLVKYLFRESNNESQDYFIRTFL